MNGLSCEKKSPAITVLLSCYNGAQWLEVAIASVLDQTYSNFEFIIVDDGSTDSSLETIHRYAALDARIVVVEKNNTGLADSLNMGIRRARGEWIARLDADDICESVRLEKQLMLAGLDSGLVFVGAGQVTINESGQKLKEYLYPCSHSLLLKNLRSAYQFPPHSSAFYRASAVRSIGGYRPRIKRSEDWDLWLRLSEVGRLTVVDEVLVRVRKHASQVSNDESGKRQIIDSRMAIVSYWLRYHGFPDPVSDNGEVFELFRVWVAQRLEQECFFELVDYNERLKANMVLTRKSPLAIFFVIKDVLSEPVLFMRLVRRHFWGDSTAHRIALEWMKVVRSGGRVLSK